MSPPRAERQGAAPGLPPALGRLMALAERDPRRGALLARARYEARPASPEETLALAWALLCLEHVPQASALLDAARARFEAAGQDGLARLCRHGQLVARQLSGEGEPLQAAWAALADACAAAGDAGAAARARCEQVAHLNLLDRHPAARALATAVSAEVERHGTPADVARHRHVAGVAAAGCGDFAAADTLFNEAIQRYAAARRPVGVARVRFERSWAAQRREQFAASRDDLTRALRTFERCQLPFRVALCRRDLGYAAMREGDLAAAIAHTVWARETLAALGRGLLVAGCDLNLGAVAHYSGLFELAEAAYERAHAAYAAAGLTRTALVCRRNQAMTMLDAGRPDEALALVERIDPAIHAAGDPVEIAETLGLRGRALAGRDPAAALACLAAARAHFDALGNAAAVAECRLNEGWLRLAHGEATGAAADLAAAVGPLAGRPAHLWRAHYGLGQLAEAAGREHEALAHYEAAGGLVAGMRRGLASEHASSALFAQAGRLYADALALAARAGDARLLLGLAEQQRALALRRQLAAAVAGSSSAEVASSRQQLRAALVAGGDGDLEATLREYVAALLHARHRTPGPDELSSDFSLEGLRATLGAAYGAAWTLLAPIVAGRELLLVTVTPDGLYLDRTPRDSALDELLERACLPRYRLHTYRDLEALRAGATPSWATLRELGRRLLPAAALARLAPAHRLLIVPDGPLHALPWAALRADGAWLAERAVVELLPTLGPLRMAEAARAADRPALLVACDTFGERAAPLPVALATLDLAERRWAGRARRLVGKDATRGALLAIAAGDGLRGYGLVHFATHAHLGGRGLLAHIKFADEDLLADEAIGLGLGGCLVVLAACSGAAGEVLPGDEILGVGRALLAAGARAVLAGLWQVYDEGITRLLDSFYAALAGGADPALALASAQRAQLAAEHDDPGLGTVLRSPLVWGGLCVTSISLARGL